MGSKSPELCVMATGGGAFKFYEDIRNTLGVEVIREDEMECLIIGAYRSWTRHTLIQYPQSLLTLRMEEWGH